MVTEFHQSPTAIIIHRKATLDYTIQIFIILLYLLTTVNFALDYVLLHMKIYIHTFIIKEKLLLTNQILI